jgi:hypothetical protein
MPKLNEGMTMDQVKGLLGLPESIAMTGRTCVGAPGQDPFVHRDMNGFLDASPGSAPRDT